MKKFILLVVLAVIPTLAIGEEVRYVTDSFSVTMRTGKGTSHKIVKSLKTGTKLDLIEDDGEGYSLVRMDNGMEGWMLSRYLLKTPVAKTRLANAEKEIKSLKKRVSTLRSKLDKTSSSSATFEKDSSRLNKSNKKLQKELDHIKEIAANQIALNDENKSLKEQLLTLKRDMQTVQQDNMSLQDSSARDWFLIGAGVCLLGIVMGLILPNLKFRRRQSWSSL